MSAETPEEVRNEQVIRSLYALAEGDAKDTSKFVSIFTDDGYFYDVAADKKYFGRDIGVTVDVYAAAFPDMHREIYALRSFGDHVLVELSLNGKAQLGPLLNGLVNYEYWLPVPKMMFPGVADMIANYQSLDRGKCA
jgi:hypothetical protein